MPAEERDAPRRGQGAGRAAYRARQFFLGFRSSLAVAEAEQARALLSEPELLLFTEMEARDRRHSFDMVRWLQARMPTPGPEPVLLRAALLHDVGKGRLHVFERVLFVVLGAISTRLRDACSRERGPNPGPALWRLRHHALLGAQRLECAGTDVRVRLLVARHTEPLHGPHQALAVIPGHAPPLAAMDETLERELAWLIAADEAC